MADVPGTAMCALCLPVVLHCLLVFLSLPHAAGADNDNRNRYVLNTKVPFYSSPSMTCDHPLLNITLSDDVKAISWVFPDGTNVYSASDVNPRQYVFSEPDSSTTGPNSSIFALYNLTALEIDEDQFGYYLCVVEYTNTGSDVKPAAVIRWGLNVNGADFSDLLKTYRENAIVGGAAAAALLVLVGGGCLFWNVRYGNQGLDDNDDDAEEDVSDLKNQKPIVEVIDAAQENNAKNFDNAAYKEDIEESAVVDVHM
ncbi:hypothetical protein PoB_001461900 [Plakobranchus ocellatus]|uniref:Ig-like domain-containing protein n=1 Tax=Plakobranchus ocellatus TaxID=259542 RepID=A0AAV3Z134_9GAST|nr:hypothetical protein PoB_001461900 [Plakobranchus ocellatus]